MILLHLFFR